MDSILGKNMTAGYASFCCVTDLPELGAACCGDEALTFHCSWRTEALTLKWAVQMLPQSRTSPGREPGSQWHVYSQESGLTIPVPLGKPSLVLFFLVCEFVSERRTAATSGPTAVPRPSPASRHVSVLIDDLWQAARERAQPARWTMVRPGPSGKLKKCGFRTAE